MLFDGAPRPERRRTAARPRAAGLGLALKESDSSSRSAWPEPPLHRGRTAHPRTGRPRDLPGVSVQPARLVPRTFAPVRWSAVLARHDFPGLGHQAFLEDAPAGSRRLSAVPWRHPSPARRWRGAGWAGMSGSVPEVKYRRAASAARAWSQAAATCSGLSTAAPCRPRLRANPSYETSGSCWDSVNFGAPFHRPHLPGDWLRSLLCSHRDDQPRIGPLLPVVLDRDQLGEAVHLHGPVPAKTMTGRPGWPNFAPIPYGTPGPWWQVARQRAAHVTAELELPGVPVRRRQPGVGGDDRVFPAAGMTARGRTSIGLTGSASTSASASIDRHHLATLSSMPIRQERSSLRRRCGSRARSVAAASPTRFRS